MSIDEVFHAFCYNKWWELHISRSRNQKTPFKDITYDICKREGEDDDLESWRNGHISFFSNEGRKLGYTFTEDMPVIFEDFKMVFSK